MSATRSRRSVRRWPACRSASPSRDAARRDRLPDRRRRGRRLHDGSLTGQVDADLAHTLEHYRSTTRDADERSGRCQPPDDRALGPQRAYG